jgi:hypothetical protein
VKVPWLAGAVLAVFALVLTGFDRPAPRALTLSARSGGSGPLLGVVSGGDSGAPARLARLDPVRLRPRRGRSVTIGTGGSWSYSPDRSALTVATRRDKTSDRLLFVDVRRLRLVPPAVSVGAIVMGLVWIAPSRLIVVTQTCCAGENGVVVVDPQEREVVSRVMLPRRVIAVGRAGSLVVLLEAPGDSIGTASLAVVSSDASIRRVALDRIAAGSDWPDESQATPIGHWSLPGLAVDPAGRAYVVGTDRTVAEVDLDSEKVRYHDLTKPSSLFERLRRWIEPDAQAKGVDGPTRKAQWLGDGLIAVTGNDQAASVDGQGGMHLSGRPSGLEIVDVRSWTRHLLNPGADAVLQADGLLLATGSSWSADGASQSRSGMGLAAYGPSGDVRFRLFGSAAAWVNFVVAGRAYVGVADERPVAVVDLAAGRQIGRRTDSLPWPLLGDASPFWG